jgi:hypothetical protein
MSYVKDLGKNLINGFVLGVGVLLAVLVMGYFFHVSFCGLSPVLPVLPILP